MVQEARVRLKCRQVGPVHIEGLDFMPVGATREGGSVALAETPRRVPDLHHEDRGMFMHAQGAEGVFGGVDSRNWIGQSEIP